MGGKSTVQTAFGHTEACARKDVDLDPEGSGEDGFALLLFAYSV
jgi:hypothetical protein